MVYQEDIEKYILVLRLNSDHIWEEIWECAHLSKCKSLNKRIDECHGGECTMFGEGVEQIKRNYQNIVDIG